MKLKKYFLEVIPNNKKKEENKNFPPLIISKYLKKINF